METETNWTNGTMDASDTYPVCDTCQYVDWERRTGDGDSCPECEARLPETTGGAN